MKQISLTQGKFAIVDDEDFIFLDRFNWCLCGKGQYEKELFYAVFSKKTEGKQIHIYMHEFVVGNKNIDLTKSNMNVIHINGNTLDNRKENLRLVPFHTVMHMRRKLTPTRSKYKGIYFHKQSGMWTAGIQKDKKFYSLSYFKSEHDAARAYNAKARELYGDLAYQNMIIE